MIPTLVESALLLVGSFFLLLSAVGLWRLGDFFQRIHAPTKAATLGLASVFAATIVSLGAEEVGAKALLAIAFIGATAPVGAHFLSRTAYRSGLRPKKALQRDDYAPTVDAETRREQ